MLIPDLTLTLAERLRTVFEINYSYNGRNATVLMKVSLDGIDIGALAVISGPVQMVEPFFDGLTGTDAPKTLATLLTELPLS